MDQSLNIILRTSIFDKEHALIIDPQFIEYDNTNFSKLEIADIRYGLKAINGYRFTIGRIYCIDVKSLDGRIIKIRLKSLYGIRRKRLGEKYKMILHALWKFYINDIVNGFLKEFINKIDFVLLGVTFTQEGIMLDKKREIISWQDLGTKNYWHYYSMFSISNPHKYRTFQYLTDWNTAVLYSVSRDILQAKALL